MWLSTWIILVLLAHYALPVIVRTGSNDSHHWHTAFVGYWDNLHSDTRTRLESQPSVQLQPTGFRPV